MFKFLFLIYKKFFSLNLKILFGGGCRFEPTCSVYAQQALEKRGFLVGTWLAVKRIIRCNPFNKGGFDPVP